MTDEIRVVQYGLGPIGSAIARLIHSRGALKLVGGVDIAPEKVGKDLGDAIGLGEKLGVPVAKTLTEALSTAPADVVVHTTSSYFDLFSDQIREILEAGLDVVSTAEELSFPWLAHRDEAERIDRIAKRMGKTALGTGVNPGFLMDALPLSLTAICQQVTRIEVIRRMNATNRRGPFQRKIGAGMTVDEFKEKMAQGRMGHVGLRESVGMIFDTLGWELTRFETAVEPLVADRAIRTPHVKVDPGAVRGLKQTAHGYCGETEFVTLTFIAGLDEPEEADTIRITGVPDLEIVLHGTNGDLATAAIVVNAIPRVIAAPPGLVTMRDLPIVTVGR